MTKKFYICVFIFLGIAIKEIFFSYKIAFSADYWLTENYARLGSFGPIYSKKVDHQQEWFFDLDILLASNKDEVFIGEKKSDSHIGIKIRNLQRLGTSIYVNGAHFSRMKYGVKLYGTGESYIYDVKFIDLLSKDKYGAAFMIGTKDYPTSGVTYIKSVYADGKERPLKSYEKSNTDFLIAEHGSGPVYVKYATAKNFSDAIVDAKSIVYIMNSTLENAHRILRVWEGSEIVIVNSIVNVAREKDLIWFHGENSTIRYHNVLWNGKPHPDPIQVSGSGRLIALEENPLPSVSPFFDNEISTVAFEISLDGKTWRPLPDAQFGTPGSALIGDLRFRIGLPIDQRVQVRVSVERVDGFRALSAPVTIVHPTDTETLDLTDFFSEPG